MHVGLFAAPLRTDCRGALMEARDQVWDLRANGGWDSTEAAEVKEAVGSGCEIKAERTAFANRLERHAAESRRLP